MALPFDLASFSNADIVPRPRSITASSS